MFIRLAMLRRKILVDGIANHTRLSILVRHQALQLDRIQLGDLLLERDPGVLDRRSIHVVREADRVKRRVWVHAAVQMKPFAVGAAVDVGYGGAVVGGGHAVFVGVGKVGGEFLEASGLPKDIGSGPEGSRVQRRVDMKKSWAWSLSRC